MLQAEPEDAVGLQGSAFCALNALWLQRADVHYRKIQWETWLRRQFQRQDGGSFSSASLRAGHCLKAKTESLFCLVSCAHNGFVFNWGSQMDFEIGQFCGPLSYGKILPPICLPARVAGLMSAKHRPHSPQGSSERSLPSTTCLFTAWPCTASCCFLPFAGSVCSSPKTLCLYL